MITVDPSTTLAIFKPEAFHNKKMINNYSFVISQKRSIQAMSSISYLKVVNLFSIYISNYFLGTKRFIFPQFKFYGFYEFKNEHKIKTAEVKKDKTNKRKKRE